jgi:hypothetical protein
MPILDLGITAIPEFPQLVKSTAETIREAKEASRKIMLIGIGKE